MAILAKADVIGLNTVLEIDKIAVLRYILKKKVLTFKDVEEILETENEVKGLETFLDEVQKIGLKNVAHTES